MELYFDNETEDIQLWIGNKFYICLFCTESTIRLDFCRTTYKWFKYLDSITA